LSADVCLLTVLGVRRFEAESELGELRCGVLLDHHVEVADGSVKAIAQGGDENVQPFLEAAKAKLQRRIGIAEKPLEQRSAVPVSAVALYGDHIERRRACPGVSLD
jgi:hypothetical protein